MRLVSDLSIGSTRKNVVTPCNPFNEDIAFLLQQNNPAPGPLRSISQVAVSVVQNDARSVDSFNPHKDSNYL